MFSAEVRDSGYVIMYGNSEFCDFEGSETELKKTVSLYNTIYALGVEDAVQLLEAAGIPAVGSQVSGLRPHKSQLN